MTRRLRRLPRPRPPRIFRSHPGYARVALVEFMVHVGLGVSAIFGSHTGPSWDYFGGQQGVAVFGVVHWLCAGCIAIGAYTDWRLARGAFIASVTVFMLSGGLWAVAWLVPWITTGRPTIGGDLFWWNVGGALLSAAAIREPLTAGLYDAPDVYDPDQAAAPR